MAKDIVVYTQGGGGLFCNKEVEFLSQKGVEFQEKDVGADEKAMRELIEIGVMTTPVTVIDGEVVVGFDTKRIEELLAK